MQPITHNTGNPVPAAGGDNALPRKDRSRLSVTLWITQAVLAALFLLVGGMKSIAPLEVLAQQSHLPGLFMRFIGFVELLGAVGLILPALLRIRVGLTPLAAAGLALVTTGATVVTLVGEHAPMVVIPLTAALLSAFVAYGRWRLAPIRARSAVAAAKPVARRNAASI